MYEGIGNGRGLDYKRAGLALIAVSAVIFAMLALTTGAAFADHEPPDDTYESVGGDGSNEGDFWETYLAVERGINDATCWKYTEVQSSEAFEMPAEPDGEDWVLLVVKQATTNYIYYDPVVGHSYPSTGDQSPGYSHIIVCSVDEPDETTTTTVPEETTTTAAEETTTTVAEETTTTVEILETTLTTAPAETTSSSVADTVLGTEVLPFTGVESEWTFWLATILALTGGLLVFGAKRAED